MVHLKRLLGMTNRKATFSSTSQVTIYAPSSHSLALLDARAATATAIVVDAAKPWVLSQPGTQTTCYLYLCSFLLFSNLTLAAKKTGADSVAVMLDGNAKMTGILPGKGRQIPDPPPKPKVPKPPRAPNTVPTAVLPKPKRPINRQPKPLPKVTWTPLPVPPSFTLDRALPRIAIREFVVRFGKLLDMSRAHLEELEEIGGRRPHEVDDADSDSEQDIEVELGWISETCLRAILLGLLNLVLSDSSDGGKQGKKPIQSAIEEIKASRANLGRIWAALASLRAEIENVDGRSIFPDPLSPPQHTKIHTTRSGALNTAGVNVTTTAQLVPIVLPLIEMVLETQAVHDELEEGIKEAKERIKEEKERAKVMREQWDMTKKNGNPVSTLISCSNLNVEYIFLFRRAKRHVQSTIAHSVRSNKHSESHCTHTHHASHHSGLTTPAALTSRSLLAWPSAKRPPPSSQATHLKAAKRTVGRSSAPTNAAPCVAGAGSSQSGAGNQPMAFYPPVTMTPTTTTRMMKTWTTSAGGVFGNRTRFANLRIGLRLRTS